MPTALAVVGGLAAYYNLKMYKVWLIDELMAPVTEKMQEIMPKNKKQMKSNEETLKLVESIRRRFHDNDEQFDQTRIVDNNNDNDNEVKNE